HQVTVPVFIRGLGNLIAILDKGAASARSRNVAESVLLRARLYPDMFALDRQIQRTADLAVAAIAAIADVPPPQWEPIAAGDGVAGAATFDVYAERLQRAVEFLATIDPARIDGREEHEIEVKRRGQPVTVEVQAHLLH